MTIKNDKLIEEFLNHLRQGKPILKKKKHPVGELTLNKYKGYLKKVSSFLNKPLDKYVEKDIEKIRFAIKKNEIKKNDGNPYKDSAKHDIEIKAIGMFFKWLGKPELIYYTDDYNKEIEIPALKEPEIKRLVDRAKLIDKLIIQLLFDGGFRIQEFLNIKYDDVRDDLRKSGGYYKIRITKSKTKPRTVGLFLEESTHLMDIWIKENQGKLGTNESLINISYRHLSLHLKRLGQKVLKKKINPHLLRHSSATYYCHKLNQYQLCKRYGWSMASDMPKRYIDREGVEEEGVGEQIKEEQTTHYRKEVNQLKEELRIQQETMKEMGIQLKQFSNILSKVDLPTLKSALIIKKKKGN